LKQKGAGNPSAVAKKKKTIWVKEKILLDRRKGQVRRHDFFKSALLVNGGSQKSTREGLPRILTGLNFEGAGPGKGSKKKTFRGPRERSPRLTPREICLREKKLVEKDERKTGRRFQWS